MKLLENEEILWQSKNKRFLLTTHRLREVSKDWFGSTIKSILLEEITFSELKSIRNMGFLKKAVFSFLLINALVYLLNHHLFKAELVKVFFSEVHIGQESAELIFYLSAAISLVYVVLYALSIRRVFCFHSGTHSIQFQTRWMSFVERESFISKVEEAKQKRKNKS